MPTGIALDNQYQAGPTYKITVADTAISLGDAGNLAKIQPTSGDYINKSASSVFIHVITSGLYFCPGGSTPVVDGTLGHPLAVGDSFTIKNFQNIKNAKFIRQGANTGAIMVTPYFNMA